MSVKHVSALKTPGMQAANPRRPLNFAAARPAQKSAVVPGESKTLTEGGLVTEQTLQTGSNATTGDELPDNRSTIEPPRPEAPSEATEAATELLNAVAPAPSPARSAAAVDYHAIISKTIEGLALNNVETRAEIYDRAREVVEQRLKDAGPAMSSHMVAVEQIAFDRAIKRIEAEQLEFQLTRAVSGAKEIREKAPAAADAVVAATVPDVTPASENPATPGEAQQQDRAPAVIVAKRSRSKPPIRQTHGGTLRLFAVIGIILAGLAGYWLCLGKPNFAGMRNIARIVTKPPQQQPQEENTNAASAPVGTSPGEPQAATPQAKPAASVAPAPAAQPAVSGDVSSSDIDVSSPDAYGIQLATFLSLCRPAQTAHGNDPCGNLQPRPFGGFGVTPRNAVEWIGMYASLSEIPRRVKKPVFTLPVSTAQTSPVPASSAPATAAPARTGNAAARERYERGLDLAKNDGLDAAISDFSEAIRLDPKFADAYVQRGQAMFKNGNAERAIADFTQALQIDPRNAPAFKARGMAMLYKGDDDGAIIDLTKAIQYAEIDTASIPSVEVFFARRSRATLYDRKQLYDRELVDLTAMIDGYWRDPSLAAALKTTYREQGAASLMASIYRLRAGVHQKRSSLDAAIGDLSLALQLDSQRTLQYLIERGRLLETAGRREQAIADYQQALELSPTNTDVRNSLTRLKGRT